MIRQGRYTKKVGKVRQAKRSTRRSWRWFRNLSRAKKIMLFVGPILAFLILTPLITYISYYNDISNQERLMNRNNTGIVLLDKNGEKFYSLGRAEHRKMVPLADISDEMEHALIAAEDKDFYEHAGFSVDGIIRAIYGTVTSQGQYGGGSTITQQLAKNTLLSDEHSFLRKYQELAVSIAIEQRYSKDEILDMYLNSVFFGGTVFGIEEAAKTYFNKAPKDLTLAESAMLVGVLPAPNAYSPLYGDPEYAKERQTTVLTRMVTNGYITETQKQVALGEALAYAPVEVSDSGEAPHFTEMVLNELYKKYGGEEKVLRSGYQVQTTLDLNLQRQLSASIANHMKYIQRFEGSNAAGVAIDPTSGGIRALVGSSDWNNTEWGKVNIVTTARQPGSSFKPIYYAEALAQGIITPATILHDVPTDFGGGYKPQNADRRFRGDVTVRSSLAQSLNIPSIKVMQKLGIDNSIAAAKRMGINSLDENKPYGLALALGAAEASPLEMTNAYAAFGNNGQQYAPTIIEQINNKFNSTIFKTNEKSKTVLSPQGAFLISNILSDNNARAPIFGSSLTVSGHTAAVKTGTTNDNRDAWTIGYTPQLAVGVWVGNNNNAVMTNGGSGMAGPIWVNTMKQALRGAPNAQFTVPSGVIQKPICYSNGGLASSSNSGTYNEYFLAQALPTTTCSIQETPPKTEAPKEETETPVTPPANDTPSGDEGSDGGENSDGNGNDPGSGNGNGGGNGGGNSGGTGGGGITIPPVVP